MNIITKPVPYMDGDTECIGYLAWDETYAGEKPCVLVNHAWGGRDGFAENKAIQMAAQGYVGFALDNYGGGYLPQTMDDKMKALTAIKSDRSKLLARLKAGMKAAAALPQVDASHMAVIGYCFGGLCALDLARSGADLKAAVSFHGLLDAPDLPKKKIKAKVLVCHGWDDPMVPHEQVLALGHELTEAGCDWQIHAYGQTSHAFTVPGANDAKHGLVHNAAAEERSTMALLGLLDEVFRLHGTS